MGSQLGAIYKINFICELCKFPLRENLISVTASAKELSSRVLVSTFSGVLPARIQLYWLKAELLKPVGSACSKHEYFGNIQFLRFFNKIMHKFRADADMAASLVYGYGSNFSLLFVINM